MGCRPPCSSRPRRAQTAWCSPPPGCSSSACERIARVPGSDFRLTSRQRASLKAIVDTFAPGVGGLPSASDHGVVEVVEEAVASNPREAERKQVAQLLGLWDTALMTAIGGGGFKRFSSHD